MTRALLSLGSNLGDRLGNLRGAVAGLADVLVVTSGVYETPPWGDPDQPPYLNAAVLVMGDGVTADDWLARAHELERRAGRERDPDRPFGPRTLDVDVIMVWTEDGLPVVSSDPVLTLPHPAGPSAGVRPAPVVGHPAVRSVARPRMADRSDAHPGGRRRPARPVAPSRFVVGAVK